MERLYVQGNRLTHLVCSSRLCWLVVVGALLLPASGLAQRRSQGQFEAAVELHPSFALSGGGSTGVGFDFRGTYWMPSRGAKVGPDFVLGWANFPVGLDQSAGVLRLMGGVRAAFASRDVTPSVFGRLGLHSFQGPWWHRGWWIWGPSGSLGAEIGGALDFRVADNVSIGGHTGLNLVSNGFAYLNLGAQVAVRF